MKFFKTLVAGALLLVGVTANAATYTDAEGNEYEFQKHFFLNLQGGAQYTLGEAKFGDLISPNVQLGLGYQFSPVVAARLQANAWQSKGGWNGFRPDGSAAAFTKDYKFNYVAPGIDLMFNLSNLICGWNPNRVFNVTAFVGGGANIGFKNDEVNDIANSLKTQKNYETYLLDYLWDGTKIRPFGRAGLDLDFRLSDAINLVLEGNANILSDKYNSKKAENPDWYFNALAGLRINLGKTYTKKVKEVLPPPPPPVEPVVEPVQPVEPVEPPAPVIEPIRRDVFFTINSTVVSETEEVKVKDIADFMKANPSSKVTVTGYADKGTGNPTINARLAAGRADVVVKELINKYGISADRISYDSKGDTVQPFAVNDMNRVAICITNL